MRLTKLLFLLAAATPLFAATYLVPPDRELIQRSDDIVIATAVATSVEERPDHSIVTRSFLRIEEVLKGVRARDSHLVLTEPGGRLGHRAQIIPAAPRYEPGKRYLVFTETDEQGETHTLGMQLGRFALDRDLALRAAIHGFDPNLEPYREHTRDARGFIDYIRAVVAQRAAEANYFSGVAQAFLPAPQASSPYSRQSYLYVSDIPVRWQDPDVTFVTTGSVASIDWGAATATAMAQWNATDTNIHYRHSGRNDAAANGFTPDGINAVQVHQQSGSGFVLASGGWTTSGNQYTFDDELFYDAAEADVVATDWQGVPLTPACWNSLLTHEIGHTLGIRHSDYDLADINPCTTPPLDCSNDAVMEAFLNCTANGALQPWDRRAATTVYCVPPSITTQPHDQQIGPNNPSVRLSVEAKGTLPITYEWFAKPEGATSFASAGNGASLSVAPQVPTTYRVRVAGACGSPVTSNDAVVTLGCTDAVQGGTASSKLLDNGTYRLAVDDATSAGRSLTYAWYSGTGGNAETLVGFGNPLEVARPARTTSYWAKVTNDCGNVGWSTPVTISVTAIRRRSVR